jgi:hypothetical protein
LHDNLKQIRTELPRLAEVLRLGASAEIDSWAKVLDTRLLTRFDPGFPLVVAVCGGGSTGKSSLFNALIGANVSPTGGRAGMNRRVLFSVPAGFAAQADFIAELLAPFEGGAAPLADPKDLLLPGGPLYVTAPQGDGGPIVLDTPDFDTGAGGRYTNRQSAQGALEAADVLAYIFTNATYNNRDNTDFIARMLTGIGRRKCFLVYRCYPSFTEAEVTEHAMTVARNIYGSDAARYVLGVYRADEDNRVAAGQQPLTLRPVPPDGPSLPAALAALDVAQVRFELHASMVADVLEDARGLLERGKASLKELRRYEAVLAAGQAGCVQEALRYFPVDRVMRRFAKIWAASDPVAVKVMRRTGSLVELPLRAVLGAAGWARDRLGAGPPAAPGTQFARKLEENLMTAVTTLHHHVLSPHLQAPEVVPPPGAGFFPAAVSAHPVVFPVQARLQQREVSEILKRILGHSEEIARIGRDIDTELRALADHFRSRMDLWDKVGQTFWAFLNVLPATAAVTYVLSTGDPVGAATIKVKLAGLFGVKDLYALVAIPVTRSLKQADRKQLEQMLGPVARTWLSHKFKKVQDLFEAELTGESLKAMDRAAAEAAPLIASIEECLDRATEGRVR